MSAGGDADDLIAFARDALAPPAGARARARDRLLAATRPPPSAEPGRARRVAGAVGAATEIAVALAVTAAAAAVVLGLVPDVAPGVPAAPVARASALDVARPAPVAAMEAAASAPIEAAPSPPRPAPRLGPAVRPTPEPPRPREASSAPDRPLPSGRAPARRPPEGAAPEASDDVGPGPQTRGARLRWSLGAGVSSLPGGAAPGLRAGLGLDVGDAGTIEAAVGWAGREERSALALELAGCRRWDAARASLCGVAGATRLDPPDAPARWSPTVGAEARVGAEVADGLGVEVAAGLRLAMAGGGPPELIAGARVGVTWDAGLR